VKPVVVVGAGIVGACVAYRLAHAGAPVTVIFRDAGVTAQSFAWIGDGGSWPGGAAALRSFVRPDWQALAAAVPGVDVQWPGAVSLFPPSASWSPTDGAIDPARTTRALLVAARDLGARIISGAEVTAARDGEVVSSAGRHPASTVVVAAGVGVPMLCPTVAAPASPAFLIRVRAPSGLVPAIVATPAFEVREQSAGHLLATAPLGADRTWTGLRALAGRTLRALSATFGPGLRLTGWTLGERPMPPHGPVIGPVSPGVYAAVMHPGICLAPVAARLIAQEIAQGRPAPELAGCRPARRP
jgi:glycine/D-amino acid oxidase-like deaminating enzyme